MIEKHLPVEKKIAVSLMQAAELIGVGYTVIKDWVDNDKSFPVFSNGKNYVIPVREFRDWVGKRAEMRIGMPDYQSVVLERVKQNRRRRQA
jgi:hypothetical protein